MAVQSVPYVETALSHSAELFRRELQCGLPLGSAGGVISATPAASVNLTAGVAGCSDLQVSAPGSGMSVNVSAGQVIVPGSLGSGSGYGIGTGYGMPTVTLNGSSAPTVSSAAAATKVQLTTQGAYYAYNDNSSGAVNLSIASSNPTNPRIDVVVAQVEDAAYSGSNNDWKLAVVTGTAAASPAVPSLPANSVVLAYVWVPANSSSIVSGDILDLRVVYNRNPFTFAANNTSSTITSSGIIVFTTKTWDLTGGYSTSTGEFTIPVTGDWYIRGCIGILSSAATNPGEFSIVQSTGTPSTGGGFLVDLVSGGYYQANCILRAPLNEGVTVAVETQTASGTVVDDGHFTFLEGRLLSPA